MSHDDRPDRNDDIVAILIAHIPQAVSVFALVDDPGATVSIACVIEEWGDVLSDNLDPERRLSRRQLRLIAGVYNNEDWTIELPDPNTPSALLTIRLVTANDYLTVTLQTSVFGPGALRQSAVIDAAERLAETAERLLGSEIR